MRARTILLDGRSVAYMADTNALDEVLNANPMRLARRLGVPVIFTWGQLADNGTIDVIVQPAPHPLCENEAAINENLNVLAGIKADILGSLGLASFEEAVRRSARRPRAIRRGSVPA